MKKGEIRPGKANVNNSKRRAADDTELPEPYNTQVHRKFQGRGMRKGRKGRKRAKYGLERRMLITPSGEQLMTQTHLSLIICINVQVHHKFQRCTANFRGGARERVGKGE